MISKYPPPKELQAELDVLNVEVTAVLAKRKAWMDAHMQDFSNFKVGDEVYDANTGRLLGAVSELYRYHAEHSPQYDTHMTIEIQFRMEGTTNCYDNSSRHAGVGPHFATRQEAEDAMRSRAEYLAWKARGEDWSEVFK